jgi:type IV pilus assembly protein PilY1
MKTPYTRHLLACALALAGLAALPASAQRLDIATDPLGTGLSSIKPNVMFILDDSGSMGRDHMPDFVTSGGTGAACFDHGDDGDTGGGSNIGGTPNG